MNYYNSRGHNQTARISILDLIRSNLKNLLFAQPFYTVFAIFESVTHLLSFIGDRSIL